MDQVVIFCIKRKEYNEDKLTIDQWKYIRRNDKNNLTKKAKELRKKVGIELFMRVGIFLPANHIKIFHVEVF